MRDAAFKGITAAVITVSDSCAWGKRIDVSGEAIVKLLRVRRAHVLRKEVVRDNAREIKACLKLAVDTLRIKLILTVGGTGLGPRDVTPEATAAVIEKEIQGIAELARTAGIKKTKNAALSRAIAGTRRNSLIINLPGSPKGARESFEAVACVIPHALAMMRGEGHKK